VLPADHDLITVGETPFTHDASALAAYVLPRNKELNMVFHFELMDLDSPAESPLVKKAWRLAELKAVVGRWQTYKRDQGFWNAVFIENHDHARVVSRFGNDSPAWRAISAKLLAVLEVTQTGTVYVYQGQELGMKNFPRTWGIEEYKDVASQNYWQLIKGQRQETQGKEDVDMEDVLDGFQQKARDHARIPMQWDASSNAGFTTGTPWMRAYEDDAREGWNAADEQCQQPGKSTQESVLAFWKRAIRVRKAHDVLTYGDFEMRLDEDERAFAYVRTLGRVRAWVVLNFSADVVEVSLAGLVRGDSGDPLALADARGLGFEPLGELVLCNYDDGSETTSGPGTEINIINKGESGRETLALRGYEARVYVQHIQE